MRGEVWLLVGVLAGCDQLFLLPHIDPPPREAGPDSPVEIDAYLPTTSITHAAAGGSHTCAISGAGGLVCWGLGNVGQLGYGNIESIGDNELPRTAGTVNVGTPVTQVAAGAAHTCVLTEGGAVRCWGSAQVGQLGLGNQTPIGDNEVPASAGIVELGTKVVQVATQALHTCAVTELRGVYCWGSGINGRLGYVSNNNIGDNELPATYGPVDVGGDVARVAVGVDHTCALLSAGNVRCWGAGSSGQLGYSSTNDIGDSETPASAGDVDIGMAVSKLTAGEQHTCALMVNGAVRCWGLATAGQLGYGNTNNIGDTETPADAGDVAVGGVVIDISAGANHTCAVLDDNTVRCWGQNASGQLGYGNTNDIGDNEVPASVGPVNVGGPVRRVFAGRTHTCALMMTDTLRCWGSGADGRLGYGSINSVGDNEAPVAAGDVPVL